jgi:hypothetical protein
MEGLLACTCKSYQAEAGPGACRRWVRFQEVKGLPTGLAGTWQLGFPWILYRGASACGVEGGRKMFFRNS